jgi:phage FluMu gp28-like protein
MKTKAEFSGGGFYPYQLRSREDQSRFKIGLWSRQTGKDFTCAAEAVMDCINRPETTWLVLACGERQALESLEKAREWANLVKLKIPEVKQRRRNREALMKAAEIEWPNGSRLKALPAKPETIQGDSSIRR